MKTFIPVYFHYREHNKEAIATKEQIHAKQEEVNDLDNNVKEVNWQIKSWQEKKAKLDLRQTNKITAMKNAIMEPERLELKYYM